MKQIEDKKQEEKQPVLPVFIPVTILRWIAYSLFFTMLLIPLIALTHQDGMRPALACGCGGLILGHFASQLNQLIKKK